MKKGFFTFASFAVAALVWGTMASASDSVLLEPKPVSEQTVKLVADETTEVTAPQAEAETPEIYYYDDGADQFNFGGYVYASWYDGFYRMNPNSWAVNQAVLFMERQLDTARNGWDWGYNVTALYGTEHAQYSDDGFDGGWGVSGGGYGMSLFECYASLGYENMSLKAGKFASPFGYESAVGPARDLNTTSYIHQHEPAIFSGAVLNWDISDRFSLNFGATMGPNNSFAAKSNWGFIFGGKFQWTDRLAIAYEGTVNKVTDDKYDYADQYLHSIVATWDINCRLQYVFETCYGVTDQDDFFGVSNYLKYKLTDNMLAVTRIEWCEEKGENNYTEITFGIKYDINEHLMIRPEIRYDWVTEGDTKRNGFSGGVGAAYQF